MKKLLHPDFKFAIVILTLFINANLLSQENTEGTLTFTVETISNGGKYSPKHILAIWIEDASGFVKTSKLRAERRKQYLYTWKNRSSENTVDAITGATLRSHQSHTITWDGTDVNGNVVLDGDYNIRVEFTDEHAQGPLYSLEFIKGPDEVSISPTNSGKFKNISLLWKPAEILAPEADFSYSAEDLTVTFINNSVNADTYNWDFGDSETSNEANPIHTYSEAGTYKVVLTATGTGGIASIEKDVTVSEPIVPEVVADFSFDINDLSVTFSNNSVNADSYNWNFGDSETSNEANPIHTYSGAGTYHVVLVAIGAGGMASTELDITVSETNVPDIIADFSYTANDLTVTFTNTSSNATSYSWDFGDTNTSSESNPIHTYDNEGTFHVVLEATAGEVTQTAEQDVTVTGNATLVIDKEGMLKVYPNPAGGKLIVENSSALMLSAYDIIGLDGRPVKHGFIIGSSQFVIGLDGLESGTYVLVLKGSSGEYSIPFVKK